MWNVRTADSKSETKVEYIFREIFKLRGPQCKPFGYFFLLQATDFLMCGLEEKSVYSK